MAVNLLEMAKGYLTDAVISRVSGSLNESPEGVQKALTGALPVFLGGLISRSSSPDGPSMLTGLIQQFMTGDSGTAAATVANQNDPDTLMSKGSGLLSSVFGSGSSLITGALSQYAGVKSSSASGLMGMAGSIITGLLGQQLMSGGNGINAGSLLSLLGSQREAVASAMPSGLSALMGNIPGMGALGGVLGGLSGAAGSAVTGATGAMGSALAGATGAASSRLGGGNTARTATPAYTTDATKEPKGFNFWPWLLAALAAGLLFYFMRGCGDKTDSATISTTNDTTSASVQDATANLDSTATTAGAMVDSASSSMAAAVDSAGAMLANATALLGAFGARKLPDGVELNIPANGIENKLIAFIEDQSKVVDKTTWFNFDRLLYETGSAKLKPESREQLQNIAAILKAYPAVNLKVGGYTDNTGNAAANKKLSQSRAEAAVTELVRLGVNQSRLEAEGYGQEHPVASNKTEEGRAQNRRTAVRVTKK
ncbi:OmpA family protein [uncultured Fibrella sp.]|uniref:OmpA family protein n=1 Tax=uncultured Fibrella sp. TaxID=1284596 RepID=UPI0035CB61C9